MKSICIHVLAFGIAKDIFGAPSIVQEVPEGASVKQLKTMLESAYPALGRPASYRLALNSTFAADADVLGASDGVALIPPVSGG